MITVEFHCHTCHSRDSLIQIPRLLTTCRKKGIQRLVVTDHNTIEGALQAQILDPQIFIIGEEILTRQGELLGFFVKESVPAGLSAVETVQALRAQGAFISVSRPSLLPLGPLPLSLCLLAQESIAIIFSSSPLLVMWMTGIFTITSNAWLTYYAKLCESIKM